MNEVRTIRVAAIQAVSENGRGQANLGRAEPLVREAAEGGARLVLLPEFLATGYELNRSIWRLAESGNGATVEWLRRMAARYGIWAGTSFLEAEARDFFNTFVLVDDSGQDVLRVRKSKPAATEAFLFSADTTPRVVQTPFGRIGVSICYEAMLASTIQALSDEDVDLVLMPMSAPTPTVNRPLKEKDLAEYDDMIKSLASDVARTLGVPTVMANKAGAWKTVSPWPFPVEDSRFPGFSTIAAASGEVSAQCADEEGVLVADVALDPARKVRRPLVLGRKWARKPPRLFKLFVISETWGWLSYCLSTRRRRAARRQARATGPGMRSR